MIHIQRLKLGLAFLATLAIAAAATADVKQQKFIEVLRSAAPAAEKAIACKQLAIHGSAEAVPPLAALLPDKELSSWARIALEAIPDPAADAALRAALDKVQGRLLVGAINSIGVRRDAKAVEPLIGRLKDADADVAAAAAAALGRIGGKKAAEALVQSLHSAPPAVRSSAAAACIALANKLLTQGKADTATRLFDLVRAADVPKWRVAAATRGAILVRGPAGVPLLVEQLRSSDKTMFNAGLRTARELPGHDVTEALVAELGRVSADRQALLVMVLADRGDRAPLAAVLQAAATGPSNVRLAAIRVLGRLGNASCVGVLLDAALDPNAELSQTAVDVLASLPGKDVSRDLAARLAKADGKARLVLIQLAGQRRLAEAVTELRKAADDADLAVRMAALAALGATVEADDLALLIARVAKPQNAQEALAAEAALRAACGRMPDRNACAGKLLAAMEQSGVATKAKFLEILGVVGGETALRAVAAAAKNSDPKIGEAGRRLLGQWMTPDAAPVLLDLAKSLPDDHGRTAALRGYIRIARQFNVPALQRLAMCREALALCRRDEDRNRALVALRRCASPEGLSLAVSYLPNPALKVEAAAAAVAIAEKLSHGESAVAAAMRQVLAVLPAGSDPKLISRAKAMARD
jgi:HEAT repeat protein